MAIRLFTFLVLIFCTWALPCPHARAQATRTAPERSDFIAEFEVAPVRLDGVELFNVRGIKSYPALKRAREIERRIIEIAEDPNVSPESIVTVPDEVAIQIMAGNKRILKVFNADAQVEGISLPTMADAVMNLTQEAVRKYREDRRPEKIRQGILLAVGATVFFLLILLLFHWVFGKIGSLLKRKEEAVPEKVIKVKSLELIEANRFWRGVAGFFHGLRILLTLAIFYVYLQFALSQFPWTRFISTQLLGLVADPLKTMGQAILGYIPKLIFLLVLAAVVTLILKFVKTFFGEIERGTFSLRGFEKEWARPTYRILRMLILIFSVIVAYPYIPGSDSAAFKGVSIFMGVLFSLGSSSAIANIVAGYSLIYRRAFKLGDRIQIGEITGDVILMRLQATHLLTIKNEVITVPNSHILNSSVINYSALAETQGLILHSNVGIGYEVPWRQVEAMLIRAAQRTPGVLQEPPPFVLQKGLGDFAVNYEINAYCQDSHRMAQAYSELHRNILDEFNEHGIQIMTPAYEGDPETPKVVPKDKWFNPPAKREPEGK